MLVGVFGVFFKLRSPLAFIHEQRSTVQSDQLYAVCFKSIGKPVRMRHMNARRFAKKRGKHLVASHVPPGFTVAAFAMCGVAQCRFVNLRQDSMRHVSQLRWQRMCRFAKPACGLLRRVYSCATSMSSRFELP